MNNCPKCGNPLQEGTNNCPICGTNILENKPVAEAPAQTAQEQPAQAPAQPVEMVAAPAPTVVAPVAPAPAVQTQSVESNPAPAAPTPVAPAPAVVAPAAPVATTETTGTTESTGILPTVERVESPTPIPSIPSSVSGNSIGINEEKPLVPNPKLEPKKPIKKTPLIVGLILIIVLGIGCFMFLKPSNTSMKKKQATEEAEPVALSSMSSNGYHLKVAEGWSVNEDGTNVILTNQDGTIAIKLEHSKANLATIKLSDIENIMNSNNNYQNVQVSEVDVSGRSSYLISTNINSLPVQIYFINGGPELIIGATIVYQSEDTKTKYEPTVMEMIVSLSYTDDSIKAIESMNEYSQMFGIFNNVTYNATNKSSVPEENQDQGNSGTENQDQGNNDQENNQQNNNPNEANG